MNITLYTHCRALKLPHKEKAVLLALAARSPRGMHEAYPSVSTLAEDTGMGTTNIRLALRALEQKRIILPVGAVLGGREKPIRYSIHSEKANTQPLPLQTGNPTDFDPKPNGNDPETQQTGVDEGFKGKEEGKVRSAACNSAMEGDLPTKKEHEEILTIFNYYLDAFDKDETLTPSRRKQGLARLREIGERDDRLLTMTAAIDMAKVLSDKKPFFAQWHCIFGKRATFESLLTEYDESPYVREAATLSPVTG